MFRGRWRWAGGEASVVVAASPLCLCPSLSNLSQLLKRDTSTCKEKKSILFIRTKTNEKKVKGGSTTINIFKP
jgi:hypothetical protein